MFILCCIVLSAGDKMPGPAVLYVGSCNRTTLAALCWNSVVILEINTPSRSYLMRLITKGGILKG